MFDPTNLNRMFFERYGIMNTIGTYILSVIGAAIICAICKRLLSDNTPTASLSKLLTSLFLLYCVISPIRNIRLHDPSFNFGNLQQQAQQAADAGTIHAQNALRNSITARVQTYIEEQGKSLGTNLQVKVTLSDDPVPIPVAVHLYGDVSPYAKAQLQRIIASNIGIQKENQIWQ